MTKGGAALGLAVYGTGALGTEVVRRLVPGPHELALGVVHRPARAGHGLGELTIGRRLGVRTTADLDAALATGGIDVLLYAGLLGETHEQVMQKCAEAGVDLIHTGFAHPEVGLEPEPRERLRTTAEEAGARILGTGLVPGLTLDILPTLIASALPDPVSVEGRIVSNLASWGEDVMRAELGIGRSEPGMAWRYDAALRDSARQLVDALGLDLDELRSEGGLLMATEPVRVGKVEVTAGEVEGFDQRVIGVAAGATVLDLSWLGVTDPRGRGVQNGVELILTGGDGAPVKLNLE